ncbi:MAG: hypothetical protein JWM04_42 [Verrucomicrobiales bacterium]|nr:hypothetical protein [Verrucomicrobiales bacterium]
MTLVALVLKRRYFDLGISPKLAYATLGLLFVNVSIGGTLTHFAAPPVLMVAAKWGLGFDIYVRALRRAGGLGVRRFDRNCGGNVLEATLNISNCEKSELEDSDVADFYAPDLSLSRRRIRAPPECIFWYFRSHSRVGDGNAEVPRRFKAP